MNLKSFSWTLKPFIVFFHSSCSPSVIEMGTATVMAFRVVNWKIPGKKVANEKTLNELKRTVRRDGNHCNHHHHDLLNTIISVTCYILNTKLLILIECVLRWLAGLLVCMRRWWFQWNKNQSTFDQRIRTEWNGMGWRWGIRVIEDCPIVVLAITDQRHQQQWDESRRWARKKVSRTFDAIDLPTPQPIFCWLCTQPFRCSAFASSQRSPPTRKSQPTDRRTAYRLLQLSGFITITRPARQQLFAYLNIYSNSLFNLLQFHLNFLGKK